MTIKQCIMMLGLIGFIAHTGRAVVIPTGSEQIKLKIIGTGLGGDIGGEFQISPTDVSSDGMGRIFVATLGGVVRVFDNNDHLLPAPYLTAAQTGNVPAGNGENGMTSIAFHPGFSNPNSTGYGKFYTQTTERGGGLPSADYGFGTDHHDVITEWTVSDVNANQLFTSGSNQNVTKREVLRVAQPHQAHNVVDMTFDNDGYLLVTSGDGGFHGGRLTDPQDPTSIYGKVLRIEPLTGDPGRGSLSANGQYRIPNDNPFADDGNASTLGEIFAVGFRSPFRISVDKQTGRVYVGNVGDGLREEIEDVSNGSNHQWGRWEGTFLKNNGVSLNTDTTSTSPLFEYDHFDGGLSVIGGEVYRGSWLPQLDGQYIFADLGENLPTARLFYGDPDSNNTSSFDDFFEFLIDPEGDMFTDLLDSDPNSDLLPLPERIISIGVDDNGEILIAAVGVDPRAGGGLDGMLIRIIPEPSSLVILASAGFLIRRRPNQKARNPYERT